MKAICSSHSIVPGVPTSSPSRLLLLRPSASCLFVSRLNFQTVCFPRPRKNPRKDAARPHAPSCLLSEWEREVGQEEELRVLTSIRTEHNDVVVVDGPKSRFLLLDSTHNVHSVFNKGRGDNWTGSYWDEFAALPAIVPDGAIGIYGLGGGTSARLMLDLWPGVRIVGWEIDGVLIDVAREFLGLADIERPNLAGGFVDVRIGDVFCDEAPGVKYAGIAVDLFSKGKVLGDLEKVDTWIKLKGRLMPGGRIMANSASGDEEEGVGGQRNVGWRTNAMIRAMREAFPGELWWKKMARDEGENFLVLTGKDLDLDSWSAKVSGRLRKSVRDWRACS
ncbi:hypothetical protein MLD38_015432 [Melastoma candidum]|uniref:Uncharacterized protein n=1 Tax=Melastoma candidum TaxID=119954 RepID=A0ACB9RJS3_9MYRT|nr:hypothetical protein MLD38_015432 [Melastoma candidum]